MAVPSAPCGLSVVAALAAALPRRLLASSMARTRPLASLAASGAAVTRAGSSGAWTPTLAAGVPWIARRGGLTTGGGRGREGGAARGFCGAPTATEAEEKAEATEAEEKAEPEEGGAEGAEEAEPEVGGAEAAEEAPKHHPKLVSVYVRLPMHMDGEALAEAFSSHVKEVFKPRVMYNHETGEHRGFGFVDLHKEEVDAAIEAINSAPLADGTQLEAKLGLAKRSHPATRKCFVGNLNPELSEEDLRNLFGQFGQLDDVRIMRDIETGESRRFGFVTFHHQQGMIDALASMDGEDVEGYTMACRQAHDQRRRRNEE